MKRTILRQSLEEFNSDYPDPDGLDFDASHVSDTNFFDKVLL